MAEIDLIRKFDPEAATKKWDAFIENRADFDKQSFFDEQLEIMFIRMLRGENRDLQSTLSAILREPVHFRTFDLDYRVPYEDSFFEEIISLKSDNGYVKDLYESTRISIPGESTIYIVNWKPLAVVSPMCEEKLEVVNVSFRALSDPKILTRLGKNAWLGHLATPQ